MVIRKAMIIIAGLSVCASSFAATPVTEKKDDGSQKIVFQSGYGFSLSKYKGNGSEVSNGFSMSQTLLYSPFRHWAFGLDFGLEKAVGKGSDKEWNWDYRDYTDCLHIGPAVSFYPLRTVKHDVYCMLSVKYARVSDVRKNMLQNNVVEWYRTVRNCAGYQFSAGYNYNFTRNIGAGIKVNAMYCYGMHVSTLLNMSFRF